MEKTLLSQSLKENEQNLRDVFHLCSDIVFRYTYNQGTPEFLILYLDGFVDMTVLEQSILRPLMLNRNAEPDTMGKMIRDSFVFTGQTKTSNQVKDVVDSVLKGYVAILTEGESLALLADAAGFDKRAIDEPKTEKASQGPRDCFTEALRTNTMLLRRRITTPRLKMESFKLGELTSTDVVLAYVEDIAKPGLIEEVRKRLKNISTQGILDAAYIEERIQDRPKSPFPQIQKTERPDTTASSLIEGKVAILVDCTPTVLILPINFWAGFQSADDYYERVDFVFARRLVRYVMMFASLTLPGLYIALTTYHPDLLPGTLFISIGEAREKSPFPTIIEVLIMEFVFEGLQEAGIRMPSQIGPLVSIVGALVVGQAAVEANIVSAPIVIVVALTGIASFVIPRYAFAIPLRILRFAIIFLAGIYGMYGVSIGVMAIMIHLVTLQSIGESYLPPIMPLIRRRLKEVLLRPPHWPWGKP
ncbi:spore gernimation protein GerA [Paenibacillus yonginensis]|uniref:Spore gernimation protein GerA n=1 Tax=Paenibacillus yonginensis TaxID=1462996 RepID=A0A1B1MZ79_9BACL|nr:spore germination protein [Paenibacillus yonginensis]ANS74481.1 spore gernimation protein GerA [Paenibacillus yonginensis]